MANSGEILRVKLFEKMVGWGFILLLALVLGCGGNSAEETLAKLNDSNIKRLSSLYWAFQKQNNWVGPSNEQEFKAFVKGYKKLQRIGIDPANTDAIFTSERDSEPFKIRYAVVGSMNGCNKPVVFESVGANDKRNVAFLNMTQREVGPEEYDTLWSSDTAKATSPR